MDQTQDCTWAGTRLSRDITSCTRGCFPGGAEQHIPEFLRCSCPSPLVDIHVKKKVSQLQQWCSNPERPPQDGSRSYYSLCSWAILVQTWISLFIKHSVSAISCYLGVSGFNMIPWNCFCQLWGNWELEIYLCVHLYISLSTCVCVRLYLYQILFSIKF